MPRSIIDEDGRVVCETCVVAGTRRARVRGLLGRKILPTGEGLLLPRTSSIHTFFLAFPIDVVFLDRQLRVRAVAADVPPFRFRAQRGSGSVLELAAGEAERVGLGPGSSLAWRD